MLKENSRFLQEVWTTTIVFESISPMIILWIMTTKSISTWCLPFSPFILEISSRRLRLKFLIEPTTWTWIVTWSFHIHRLWNSLLRTTIRIKYLIWIRIPTQQTSSNSQIDIVEYLLQFRTIRDTTNWWLRAKWKVVQLQCYQPTIHSRNLTPRSNDS